MGENTEHKDQSLDASAYKLIDFLKARYTSLKPHPWGLGKTGELLGLASHQPA